MWLLCESFVDQVDPSSGRHAWRGRCFDKPAVSRMLRLRLVSVELDLASSGEVSGCLQVLPEGGVDQVLEV